MAHNKFGPSHSRDMDNFYYTNKLPQYNHPNIEVGEHTYGFPSILLLDRNTKVKIGKFCSIAPGANLIMGGNHKTNLLTTYPFTMLKSDWPGLENTEANTYSKGDVTIGNDVWIGVDVTIMSGVTIGDGAVIGANAVIAKDIAPYSIVVGNPAREVKKRFDDDVINSLLKIKWWDWPLDKIREHTDVLCSNNIETLIALASEKEAV